MLDRFDELELLDLIEGELDPRAAGLLKQRLSGDPTAMALIERLQTDRRVLRSIQEPHVPVDFLSKIEPLLARPMLMEPARTPPSGVILKPDEFRRQYRKRTRRIRWSRLAAVAVIFFALLAGVWAAVNELFYSRPAGDSLALNGGAAASDGTPDRPSNSLGEASAPQAPGSGAVALADGTIHHYRPLAVPSNPGVPSLAVAAPLPNAAVTPSKMVIAEFAIVLQSTDAARTEQAVQQSLVALGDQTALVRNFSYAEAQRLEGEWLVANGRQGDQGVASAAVETRTVDAKKLGVASSEMQLLAERVRQRLSMNGAAAIPSPVGKATNPGGQIAGGADLAPSLEQQLDFSSRGATYTVAAPANQVAKLIETLNLIPGQLSALQMLPSRDQPMANAPKSQPEPWQPIALWLAEGPQVRLAIQRLSQARDSAVVLIPVIVRSEPPKHSAESPK